MKLTHGMSVVGGIILNGIFLHYVYTLEKNQCGCSDDWRRDYIKYYSIIMITSVILVALAPLIKSKNFIHILMTIYGVVGLAGLVNLYCLFSYSKKLRQEMCKCSNSWERTFIYTYSIIVGVLWILAFVLSILLIPRVIIINVNSAKKVTRK